MVRDPVCGMMIDVQKANGSLVYEGVEYFFCSPGCLKAFQETPKAIWLSRNITRSLMEATSPGIRKGGQES